MDEEIGMPLKEFAQGRKQPEIAALLGVTQGAVSQMLKSERDIRVRKRQDGSFQAVEIRPVGSRRKPAAA
ncbi:Cro/CI family transcriptional regulator [Metapseudomonas furukawaii]|uniref:Cro/CI family transcriptional regulator n=1 Tax=Metapseudomonas furukawaii TaxID=1149133 RepID=UPI00056A5FDA|nr:Cro/CI family transcriptional regulator [Pseudomonas furukawaii]